MLTAEGLSPSVRHGPEGFVLGAPIDEAERAANILSAYESEKRDHELRREQESRREPEPVAAPQEPQEPRSLKGFPHF